MRLPYGVAYAAGVASTAWANLTGTEPRVPLDAVRMARKKMFVSHDKAKQELDFHPSGVDAGARSRYRVVRTSMLFVAAEAREFTGLLRFCGKVERVDWPLEPGLGQRN